MLSLYSSLEFAGAKMQIEMHLSIRLWILIAIITLLIIIMVSCLLVCVCVECVNCVRLSSSYKSIYRMCRKTESFRGRVEWCGRGVSMWVSVVFVGVVEKEEVKYWLKNSFERCHFRFLSCCRALVRSYARGSILNTHRGAIG